MNGNDIIDAIGGVDEKLIKRADRRSGLPVPVLAAAALAAALLVFGLVWAVKSKGSGRIRVQSPPEFTTDIEACYRGAVIYKGGYYVSTGVPPESADIRGKYIGTSEGVRGGGLQPDPSVKFAASLKGSYYTVKGVDPRYMLCSVTDEGNRFLFICYGLDGVEKGSDVLEDMLHVSKGPLTLTFKSLGTQKTDSNGFRVLNAERRAAVRDFIRALDESRFVPAEFYGSEKLAYNVCIALKNGLTAKLFLSEDGMVWLMGINDHALDVGEEAVNALTRLLDDPANSRYEGERPDMY